MSRLGSAFRHHAHFIIVVAVLLVVMTWPTIVHVFDTTVFWLPIDSGDVWIKFWDAWYGKLLITGQADFYHTDLSFYPHGLSLAYHIFTIPHMILFNGLQFFVPASNAYNLTYLFIIFSAALSAYVYLLYLIKDKWVSLFGAVIFGFSGYIAGRMPHPAETFLATLPLALYFFHRAVLEGRWLFIVISGCLVGITAFIGMYAFACLLMTLGAYILCFAVLRWRNPGFWRQIILLLTIIGSISILRIYPMLDNSRDLASILSKGSELERENDLLQYFINYDNPAVNRLITNRITTGIVKLANPGRWNSSYLGYVPLVLIGWGLWRGHYRRRMLPWLILALPFLILRLGSVLTINNQQTAILLPKHYLDEIFPTLFQAFYAPDHFQIGVLFPLAVLSGYGLLTALQMIPARRSAAFVLVCTALLAAEYYRSPESPRIVTAEEIAFLDWLAAEEGEIRLINLPTNRGNSKQYLFYQTLSGYPQVEGLATRTPSEAYRYIDANHLLHAWRGKSSAACTAENRAEYLAAARQLLDDGFSHIILHFRLNPGAVADSFANISPAYEDGYVAIYHVADLPGSCP